MAENFSKKSSLLTLLAITLVFAVSLNGFDDWPHWRGPNRDDRSTESGLLQEWPSNGPRQLWVNKESGLGYSGFAIAGDKLFTMGLEGDSEFALCMNAENGLEQWRTDLGKRFDNNWGDGPRSTPSVNGDRVYFMAAAGTLACLDRNDGTKLWSVNMADFGGSVPTWGYAESPLVDDGKVICTPGGGEGTLLALDKNTGKKLWQSPAITRTLENGSETPPAKAHYSSILPINWNNQRQYVQLTAVALVGVHAQTGDKLWQSDWPGRTAVIPSPIFDGGEVYATSGYGVGSKLVKIEDDNTLTDLWYSKDMQNHHGGVIKIGDYFYGSSAQAFVCQNRIDGKMMWSDRKIKKGALTYADGLFYHVQEDDGKVLLISADEHSHQIQGSFVLSPQTKLRKPAGKIWVHPVIARGKLYLRDQEMIYCYDVKAK